MAGDRNLKINFVSESDQLKRDVAELDRKFGSLFANIKTGVAQGIGQQLTQGFTGAVSNAIAQTQQFGASIIQVGSQFEQTEIAFKTFLGSAEKAKSVLKDLTDFAASTPFELPEVQGAARNLLAFGVSSEKLIPTLKALGDVSAGVSQPLSRLVTIYGQVLSKGRLQGEELLQFSEAGVPLAKQLATQLGVTEGELQKLVSSGKVGFEEVKQAFTAMTSEGGKFFDLMSAQSSSVGGKISNLNDQFTKIKVQFFEASKPIIGQVVDLLGQLASGLEASVKTGSPELAKSAEALKKALEGSPELAKELGEALGEVGITLVTDLVSGAEDLAGYLKENPDAIQKGIDKAGDFAKSLGVVLKTASQIAAKLAEAASKLPDLVEGAQASGFGGTTKTPYNPESFGSRKAALTAGVKPEDFDKAFDKRVDELIGPLGISLRGDVRKQAAQDVFQKLIDQARETKKQEQAILSEKGIRPSIAFTAPKPEVKKLEPKVDAKKEKTTVKKIEEDVLKTIQESSQKAEAFLTLSTSKRRALLLESLVRRGKDEQSGAAQLLNIEQQSMRDRIAINQKSLKTLRAAKIGAKPEDVKRINAEINAIELESSKTRGDLAQSELQERQRIEDEKQRATEERIRKQQEAEQKALDTVKESTSTALEAVKKAETERLITIQRSLNAGILTEEQANRQRLDSRRKELNDELYATQQQVAKLEALPRFSDPEREKQRQADIRAARQQTANITLSLLETEQDKQKALQDEIIRGIETRAKAEKNRSDRTVAGLDREKAAIDAILATSERINKLNESRLGIVNALANLEQARSSNQISSLNRAEEIRKQLDDDTSESAQVRAQLEKELAQLTGSSGTSQLQIIQRRQKAEDELAAQQQKARDREQAAQRVALENEIRRNKLLAERSVIEARIAEIRSRQQLVEAERDLAKARQSDDKQAIADAETIRDLTLDSVKLAGDNVRFSTQQVTDQKELADNSRQQLGLEQQATNEQSKATELTRNRAQDEALVKAGGNPVGQNRYVPPFEVIIPKVQLPTISSLRLTPESSPIAPQAFAPPLDIKNGVSEIMNQLKTMNANIKVMNANFDAVARSPKNLFVQTPRAVEDAAKIYSEVVRGAVLGAGLG